MSQQQPAPASPPSWSEQDLVRHLKAHPPIVDVDGEKYYTCQYTKCLTRTRCGFPRASLRFDPAKAPKNESSDFHGCFRDANCAAGWLHEHKASLPSAVVDRMTDALVRMCEPTEAHPLIRAPPADALKKNGGKMSLEEWDSKYKGPHYAGVVDNAAADDERRKAAPKDSKKEKKRHEDVPMLEPGEISEKKSHKKSKAPAAAAPAAAAPAAPAAAASSADPVANGAPKPALPHLKGGKNCTVGNMRGKSTSAEVQGGAWNTLGRALIRNIDKFETNPSGFAGTWTLHPSKTDKNLYQMDMRSINSDVYVTIDGLELRNAHKRPHDSESQIDLAELTRRVAAAMGSGSGSSTGTKRRRKSSATPMDADVDIDS